MSSPASLSRPRAAAWGVAFGLVVATLALYAPVLRFEFIHYDDPYYVLLNPHVSRGLGWGNVRWALTAFVVGNWHPLTLLSHMADVSLLGMQAGGHHAVNAALHAANAALLFLFFDGATRRRAPSFAAAVLFAVHPLNVESVAWISQRKSVLCMLWITLTLIAYSAWVRRGGAARYLAAIAAAGAALAAKPMAVVVPGLLLLLDAWPLGRWPQVPARRAGAALRLLAEKAPFAALAAAAAAATWNAQRDEGALGSVLDHPAASRLGHVTFAYAWYLLRMLWPSRLSLFYPTTLGDAALLKVIVSALLAAAVTLVVVAARRSRPYLAFGWGWYLLSLAPVVGVINFGTQIVADRYAYLPLIGPFVALSFLVSDLLAGRSAPLRGMAATALAAAFLALTFATGYALAPWHDSLSILRNGYARAPGNLHAVAGLGLELVDRGSIGEGTALLKRAADTAPLFSAARANLGYAYAKAGRLDEARAEYEAALRQQPNQAGWAVELGSVLSQLGRMDEAEARFRQAASADPENGETWLFLGEFLTMKGEFIEAERCLERAASSLNDDGRVLTARGVNLEALGRHDEAVRTLRRAVERDPGLARARAELQRIAGEGNPE